MILRSYLRLADASEKEVFDKTHITTFLSLFPPEPSGDDTSPPLLSGQSGMADRVGVKKKKKKILQHGSTSRAYTALAFIIIDAGLHIGGLWVTLARFCSDV